MAHHAIFLDRDDTINFDTGYLGDPDKVELYPGVLEGLSELKNKHGFKLFVISNQSGITRKLLTESDVQAVNARINELLSEQHAEIDAFYYCPYHPEFDPIEKCLCRKPSPKLVFEAAEKHEVDITKSYMIGDKACDVECGINAGLRTILIKNSLNDEQINNLHNEGKYPNFVADNFTEACDFIVNDIAEVTS